MQEYNKWIKKRNGTSFRGHLLADYRDIVKTYGEPIINPDNDKIDAEWTATTPYGTATIYNYKDGKSYLGDKGLAVTDIFEWHIGGKDDKVVEHIKAQIISHVIRHPG